MNKKTIHRHFPHVKNDRYYNNADDRPESFLFQTLPSFISSLYGRKKRQSENKNAWIHQDFPLAESKEPVITWIGHASFLIQVADINIITDPIFGDASFFFPRVLPPGIALEHLPRVDYVLLSHNHRDHCDLRSLHALRKLFPHMAILVPKGDRQWLEARGLGPVVEHDWWQVYTHETREGPVKFTFLPAHHWSAQGVFDRNKSLWGSWMISSPSVRLDPSTKLRMNSCSEGAEWRGISGDAEDIHMVSDRDSDRIEPLADPSILLRQGFGGQVRNFSTQPVRHSSEGETAGDVYTSHIYFAGDTSYADHFAHIANEFPSITLALMPIAPETPHPWMRKSHMDSQQAVQAFIDLKAHHFMPMHWGTFQFGLDTFHGPIDRLKTAWNHHQLGSHRKLTLCKVGQRITL